METSFLRGEMDKKTFDRWMDFEPVVTPPEKSKKSPAKRLHTNKKLKAKSETVYVNETPSDKKE